MISCHTAASVHDSESWKGFKKAAVAHRNAHEAPAQNNIDTSAQGMPPAWEHFGKAAHCQLAARDSPARGGMVSTHMALSPQEHPAAWMLMTNAAIAQREAQESPVSGDIDANLEMAPVWQGFTQARAAHREVATGGSAGRRAMISSHLAGSLHLRSPLWERFTNALNAHRRAALVESIALSLRSRL